MLRSGYLVALLLIGGAALYLQTLMAEPSDCFSGQSVSVREMWSMNIGVIRGGAAVLSAGGITFYLVASTRELGLSYNLWVLLLLALPFLIGIAVDRLLWGPLIAWAVMFAMLMVGAYALGSASLDDRSLGERFLSLQLTIFGFGAILLGLLGAFVTRMLRRTIAPR